jgi:hypothetical protein
MAKRLRHGALRNCQGGFNRASESLKSLRAFQHFGTRARINLRCLFHGVMIAQAEVIEVGDPLGEFSFTHSMILGCSDQVVQSCSIPLPQQSPLGIYEHLHFLSMGEWPLVFLCLRHMRLSVRFPDNIHLVQEMKPLGQRTSPLWKIECQCARENCGEIHTFYTGGMPDWPSIRQRLLKTTPKVVCGDHDLLWREELMHCTEYPHDSPMR